MNTKHADMPMDTKELAKMREKLAEMVETHPEEKVRAYLDKVFPRLPKAMQEDLAMSLLISSVKDETRELDTLHALQEEGSAAVEALALMRDEAEKQPEA